MMGFTSFNPSYNLPSRQRVDLLVPQVSRYDRDRDRVGSGGFAEVNDQGAGPLLLSAGCQHEDADVLVLIDQLEDLVGQAAFADNALRRDAGNAIGARRIAVEHRVGLLVRLGA